MRCEVCGVRCELQDAKARMHNVHPSFSSFSAEISKLKDEKTLMHYVHSGSHPLSFYGWLELLPGWLDFLPGWLESLPGWLEFLPG